MTLLFGLMVLKVATDTSVNAPIGLNRLDFLLAGANNFFGKTKALAVWKEALSDARTNRT